MNILLVNLIMTTHERGVITRRKSLKDCIASNLAKAFVSLGHRVTIAAARDFMPTEPETYDGYEVLFFRSRWPRLFKPYLLPWPEGFAAWLREHERDYDLIISSEVFSIASLMAARVCPAKLMVWHELAVHQRLGLRIPSKFWYNIIARGLMRDSLVVARSQAAHAFISRYMPRVSPVIVDHGANVELFYPGDHVVDAFLVLARLVPGKNVDKIINTFARLVALPRYAHYKLHIVGDGNRADALRAQVEQMGLTGSVIFHGFLRHHEFTPLLRTVRAMLINTSMDMNMLTIPEAIASGTPVVTNTLPTTATFVVDNGLGIARDGWDERDLIDVIEHYGTYHNACLAVRDSLTNVGCARRMIEIFNDSTAR